MEVRLGIVCPRRSRATFGVAASSLSGVIPRWISYDDEDGIRPQVERVIDDCDSLAFSGHMPLDRCRDLIPEDLPTTVVQLTGLDVALCLLRARDRGLTHTPMSIDSVEAQLIEELVTELDLDASAIARMPYGPDVTIDEVLAFHGEAHDRLGTVFAITGRSNAAEPLRSRLRIPVFEAVPVVSSIRAAMNRAALSAVSRRYADLRFAAAVFRVLDESSLAEGEFHRLSLARALHESVELAEAWVEARTGGQDVLVFGHKGQMQRATQEWTALPTLEEMQDTLGVQIAVGFGLGNSARHSVEYAEAAVRRAARDGGGCGYLLSEDGIVIGPMRAQGRAAARHRFKTDDEDIAALAGKLGLSIGTVSQLLELQRRSADAVSAADIGRELRLTPPSGRRIVRILQTHGVIARVGISQMSGRGRPASLYRLNLEEQLASSGR
jgi:hypothetical protein